MARAPALVEPLRSSDQDEGVRTFQEKRKPQWQGAVTRVADWRAGGGEGGGTKAAAKLFCKDFQI